MDEVYVLFGDMSTIKTRVALMGGLGVCYGVHGLEKMALSIFGNRISFKQVMSS